MTQPHLDRAGDAGPHHVPGRPGSVAGPLGRAVALAAVLLLALAFVRGAVAAVVVILAVIVMVMLHELGHFVTAKWASMKVTEYFFGFGPRLWSFRRGETEYGVKALPLGGYVKILGMHSAERNVDPADEPRTYRQQPYHRRLAVAVAGSAMHFVIAFVLMMLVWTVVGVPRYDRAQPKVGSITRIKGTGASPAEKAGFRVGDRIVAVDGRPVSGWEELPEYIRSKPGQPITFEVVRGGERLRLTAVPDEVNPRGEKVGFVGIGPFIPTERVDPLAAVARSGRDVGVLAFASVKALAQFFTPGSLRAYADQVTGQAPREGEDAREREQQRFLSFVGLVRIAGQAAENGVFNLLQLLVLINVFVGMFNMVPLLPLDGGHVAIATYERIRSRNGRRYYADVTKLIPLTAGVVAVLAVIFVTSLYLDIVRPLANPFQ